MIELMGVSHAANKAINATLQAEGKLSENKNGNDPGGITNFGASLRWLQSLGNQLGDIDGDGDIDAEDVRKLTASIVANLFYKKFWRKEYDLIPSPIAVKVFDMAVNMGNTQSHILLQRSIMCAWGGRLEVDGDFGKITVAKTNNCSTDILLAAIRASQLGFYKQLIALNDERRRKKLLKANGEQYEDLSVFDGGWSNRALLI